MLLVTLGEVYSTNCELLAHLMTNDARLQAYAARAPVGIIGSRSHFADQTHRLGIATALPPIIDAKDTAGIKSAGLHFVDIDPLLGLTTEARERDFMPAEALPTLARGRLAVSALDAVRSFSDRDKLAVVTGPIDKYVCRAAGFAYPGQTEFFETLWGSPAVMLLAGPRLKVGLATNHLPLSSVTSALTPELIEEKLRLLEDSLQRYFHVRCPRIAVCALNPHAGDGGMFGDEDERILKPLIRRLAAQGMKLSGPHPSDTVFYRAYHGAYDAVLAMYHDQGLGPLKTVHFDEAVNLSGGLRHLRVSPDHGPAQDLFLKNKASHASWKAAMHVALNYLEQA